MAKRSELSEAYSETGDSLAVKYFDEFKAWREDLEPYWREIDKDQEMYEFYKREYSETSSDVALNTPFSIIESMVARFNDTSLSVPVRAKGMDGLDRLEEFVGSAIHDAIEDPDVEKFNGTFRKLKEMAAREFLVKGNLFVETSYFYKTDPETGKVLADNPRDQILPYKSVIFNPAYQADSSPVYYIEKHVSFATLKQEEEREEEAEYEGVKATKKRGKYKNLSELREHAKKHDKIIDAADEHFVSDGRKIARKVEPIRLLERWEGAKLCVIACVGDGKVIIREAYDPKKCGDAGLHVAMNYKIAGRPYAYGEVRPIYKLVRAQDTVLNQSIEVVNRYLRPTIFVSDTDMDLDTVMIAIERGGVTYGDHTRLGTPDLTLPPGQAFTSIDVIQQGIERTSRYSPYAAGQLSQATDKTQGTASGIQSIQEAAEPNFQVKLDALQDSWLRPMARTFLRMIANTMSPQDVRYTLLRGEKPQWVQATKNLLLGQPTIGDLVTTEVIQQEDLQDPDFVAELLGQFGITDVRDALEETVLFDIDWLIDVKLDSQSAADKEADTAAELAIIQMGQAMGVQYSGDRVTSYFASKRNFTRHDELKLTEEEQQALLEQQLAAQQQQMMLEEQRALEEREFEMQKLALQQEGEMQRASLTAQPF